jgi:hypothetical protein
MSNCDEGKRDESLAADDRPEDEDPLLPRSLPLEGAIPPVRWPLALFAGVVCGAGAVWQWATRGPSLVVVVAAVASAVWMIFAAVKFALRRVENAEPGAPPDRRYPMIEFGIPPLQFFIRLLRACPPGSRLTFDASEPDSFVRAFRQWSHRKDVARFEADEYSINTDFIALTEQLAARGELELEHHFGISASDGRLLCASWDDFMVVTLADDVREAIQRELCCE